MDKRSGNQRGSNRPSLDLVRPDGRNSEPVTDSHPSIVSDEMTISGEITVEADVHNNEATSLGINTRSSNQDGVGVFADPTN